MFWHEDEEHPSYRDDVLVKGLTPREHTYTGLQHDATYKFRIHACNEDHKMVARCGWWTTPPLEVTTQRAPTPQRPHTIGFSQLSASSVVVTWSAAANTGGVPLTGFDITYWPYDAQNANSEAGATTHPADDGNDRGETLKKLAASTEYEVKMRACNGPKDSHCSRWSADHRFTTLAGTTPTPTPSPSPSAPVPVNLDVAPLTGRRAELTWDAVDSADAYDVEAQVFGGTSWNSAICAASGSTPSGGRVSEPRCTINLGAITGPKAGLSQSGAFAFHIRSVTGGSPGDFSEPVVIMDTPIVAASGASPSTGGQATVTWNPVQQTLGDSFPAGGTYAFRYRKVVNDAGTEHTESTWEPNAYIPVATTTTNPYTGLTLYAVYGIQLIYTPPEQGNQPAGPRVFAARDVYVWPSDEAAGSGDRAGGRVATYPLNFPLDNANYVPRATYVYRLCDDTLPELNLHGPGGRRDPWRVEWSSFIFNAFDQWRVATNELVFVNQEHQPCAEYSALVAQTVQAVQAALGGGAASAEDAKNLASHVRGLLERSRHVGVLRDAVLRAAIAAGDEVANEVFMYASNDLPMVFGFGAALEPGFCGANAVGCAIRRGVRHDTKGWITDIALKKQGHFEPDESAFIPEIPEVRFDTCQPRLPNNQTHDSRFAKVYFTLVHELGHALGIREGSDGAGDHPDRGLQSDAAMAAHLGELCSPTPFDVMAVQALYQHRDSPAP
ncbi:MAG: fibronectin type III domain-containing protein [Chloroflexi bacterium]|nr:fibronectin type III domain-containing protein [Chloroflexota bacterium]